MNPVRLLLQSTEDIAATTIQAHYRGFAVRRTRPLQKLSTISQVRLDLKEHMQLLAEPAQYEKLCKDPQERLRWSECAMALLLRLDSVQGAHADVRNIRKVATKEVITFQEIIDSTSMDVNNGRRRGHDPHHDLEVALRNLFFALQHLGWMFVSGAKELHGK